MKELSLYLLDLSQNSIAADARTLNLSLVLSPQRVLTVILGDDGRGMSPAFLAAVTDPFTTTRTTRSVGMGIPLLRLAAEQTGGCLAIESTLGVGTTVTITFYLDHIDCPPMGDLPATLALLLQGAPHITLNLTRRTPAGGYDFSTDAVRAALGDEISLAEPEVYAWLREYLEELEESVAPKAAAPSDFTI